MQFRCAGISDSTIDGIGIGLNIFFQGCSLKCDQCQNPGLQDKNDGYDEYTKNIINLIEEYNDYYDSICFLGGEPCEQTESLHDLVSKLSLPKVLYTGWLYRYVPIDIRDKLDIIVDGPYIERFKTDGFPASKNQKVYGTPEMINRFMKNKKI
jgi:anaerobic ribonucleoside-triphosphate reductase activating protein